MTTAAQSYQRRLLLRLLIVLPAILGLALILLGGHALATPPPTGTCFATANDGGTVRASADAHAVQQAVDDASAGGTVKVAGRCVGVESRAGTSQSAYISKTLTLIGGYTNGGWATSNPVANPTVIDANGLGRVLRVEGVDATIVNLILQKGNFSGTGGALSGSSAVTLTNVSVLSSTASSSGGGVFANGALRVTSSRIQNNSTTSNGGGLSTQSTLWLSGTQVISNTANNSGGGAYSGASSGFVRVTSARFERNRVTSSGNGGGLYASASLSLTNTQFISNSAPNSGGGAYSGASSGAVNVADSRFENNRVTSDSGNGGGLYASGSLPSLTGTQFISNSAPNSGGGAYSGASSGVVNVADSRFENNHSTGDFANGGGLYASASLSLTNTQFISNSAPNSGGGAYSGAFNGAVNVADSRFENNRVTSDSGNGGGLYASGSLPSLTGTQFISNSAPNSGGGAYSGASSGVVNVADSRFENNHSTGDFANGGGLYASASLSLTNTQFISNSAPNSGGGAYSGAFNGAVNVADSRFENNRVTSDSGNGGGLYASGSLPSLTGTQFISNSAPNSGGGAYSGASSGVVNVADSRFENNHSTGDFANGGGLYASASLSLTNTQFISNSAPNDGGGAYSGASSGVVNVADSRFENNHSTGDFANGGGLYTSASLSLTNTQFISNSAPNDGGGAYSSAFNGVVNVTNSRFENNHSTGFFGGGGGLSASGSLSLTGTQFLSNSSLNLGGGAAALGATNVISSRFENNHISSGEGGALGTFSSLWLSNTQFISNTASGSSGGALAFGAANVTSSRFENNRAGTGDGGGLSSLDSLLLTDTQFISNTAALGVGGGAFTVGAATAVDSTFAGNNANGSGGGLCVDCEESIIPGVSSAQAEATGSVVAATVSGPTLTLINTRFLGNTAGGNGGGVSASTASGKGDKVSAVNDVGGSRIVNSLFARNRAESQGNAIYLFAESIPCAAAMDCMSSAGIAPAIDGSAGVEVLYTTISSPTLVSGAAIVANGSALTVKNSIITNHAVGIQENNAGVVDQDHNLFYGNTTDTVGTVSGGANSLVGNPAFLNPAADDYHLTVDSLALALATDVGVYTDFENDFRPNNGFDAGYDEAPYAPPGTIVVQKVVVGAPPASAWQFSGPTPSAPTAATTNVFTLPAAGGSRAFPALMAGDYTIAETQQPGFNVTSACSAGPGNGGIDPNLVTSANGPIASGGASILVTLGGGQTITCTFTNTRVSVVNITIVKDTEPPSSTNFRFTGSYLGGGSGSDSGASVADFYLDDPTSDDGDAYGSSKSFSVPIGAVYSFSEPAVNGWYLMSITCNPAGSATVNLATRSVTINTSSGQDVVCTFRNEQAGVLNVRKYREVNGLLGQQAPEAFLSTWTIRVMTAPTNTLVTQAATNALGKVSFSLKPGSYTVCEVMKSGWRHWRNPTNLCFPVTLVAGGVTAQDFGNCLTSSCPAAPPVAADEPAEPGTLTLSPDEITAWVDAWLQTPDGPVEETLEPDITEGGDAGLRVFLPLIGGQ
jgi:hypothetical protein